MSQNPTTAASSSQDEFTTVPIDNEQDVATTTKPSFHNKEKTSNRMIRTTKNAWRRAIGCCKKSSPRTKIHFKQNQIVKAKKAFGMEYMDLLRNKATEEQLQQVIQACLTHIQTLEEEIASLEQQIDQVSEETNAKLKPKPLTGPDKKPIYPESGLYIGDPSLEDDAKTPPEAAFSITSEDNEDGDSNPDQESWMPPPPSTPPAAVPAV